MAVVLLRAVPDAIATLQASTRIDPRTPGGWMERKGNGHRVLIEQECGNALVGR